MTEFSCVWPLIILKIILHVISTIIDILLITLSISLLLSTMRITWIVFAIVLLLLNIFSLALRIYEICEFDLRTHGSHINPMTIVYHKFLLIISISTSFLLNVVMVCVVTPSDFDSFSKQNDPHNDNSSYYLLICYYYYACFMIVVVGFLGTSFFLSVCCCHEIVFSLVFGQSQQIAEPNFEDLVFGPEYDMFYRQYSGLPPAQISEHSTILTYSKLKKQGDSTPVSRLGLGLGLGLGVGLGDGKENVIREDPNFPSIRQGSEDGSRESGNSTPSLRYSPLRMTLDQLDNSENSSNSFNHADLPEISPRLHSHMLEEFYVYEDHASPQSGDEETSILKGTILMYQEMGLQDVDENTSAHTDISESSSDSLNKIDVDSENSRSNEYSECIICSTEYEPEHLVRKLRCGHYYHQLCVDKWFEKDRRCPYCKQDITVIKELSNPGETPITNNIINNELPIV